MRYDLSVLSVPPSVARLDAYLSEALGICTRNQLQKRSGVFFVNDRAAKPSRKIRPGDRVSFVLEDIPPAGINAENIPLTIIYEDANVVLIDKPQGMVVHPGAGNRTGTLSHALMYHVDELGGNSDRPGIVHRLDKETSGIIITAKNEKTLEYLAAQFRDKTTRKVYLAIVAGSPLKSSGRIESHIARSRHDRKKFTVTEHGGKPSATRYKVLARYPGYCFVVLSPETGRTHQLRVHMRSIGCPVAGDPVYGNRADSATSLMLHAYTLRICLPGHVLPSRFRAPLPERFKEMLVRLGREHRITVPQTAKG